MDTLLFRNAQRTRHPVTRLDVRHRVVSQERIEEIDRRLALYAEHTFGYSNTSSHSLLTHQVFTRKTAHAVQADELAGQVLVEVLRYRGEGEFSARRPFSYKVINPLDQAVRAAVQLPVDYWEEPFVAQGVRVIGPDGVVDRERQEGRDTTQAAGAARRAGGVGTAPAGIDATEDRAAQGALMLDPVRPITMPEVLAARERIMGTVVRTPLLRIDLGPGAPDVRLKLENLQPINAYKLRGAVSAVASVALARMLEPRTFGLFAIAGLFIGFTKQFQTMGMGKAAIRMQKVEPADLNTLFTVSLASSGALCAGMWGAAPLLESLFHEPAAVPVLRLLALGFLANKG